MRIVVQQIRVLVAVTAFTSGSWFNINSVKVAHEMTMTCNKLYVVEIRLEEFWDLRFWESSFWNFRLQWWCCYSNSKTHKKNIYNWEVCCCTTVTIDNIGFDIQESKSHWFSWIFFYPDKPTTRRCFFEIAERLSSEIAIIVVSFIWEFFDISGWEQIIYRSIRF